MEDLSKNMGEPQGQNNRGEDYTRPAGQSLGIAALITAIVTFVVAVIPCVGIIAVIPGIIAVVLASVGISQAARSNSPRGIMIAALVIAVVACVISLSQVFVANEIAGKVEKNLPGDIERIIEDVQEDVKRSLEDANVNIKVESNGESIEIISDPDRPDRIEKLEELESATEPGDTLR